MKILLPVDGSKSALAAVAHALGLRAAGLDAQFLLANVQEPPSLYEVIVAHDADVIDQVRRDAGADLLQAAEALLDAAGAPYESVVAGGQAAHVLVDLLEEHGCDAVVMGAHGVGGGDGAEPGPVAQALLRHSPVPVTLVRASEVTES
ncbi:MAG: universal stress protein [Rubrivivax sp.]|nr:universal stress protein [Rubrivivax sp.]